MHVFLVRMYFQIPGAHAIGSTDIEMIASSRIMQIIVFPRFLIHPVFKTLKATKTTR